MNVLVLGGGGREHALAWRLAQDRAVSRVFCAPGNAGIARVAELVSLDPCRADLVCQFVRDRDVALTVVGPELPLTHGVVDALMAEGRRAFGPTRAAAEIESSKVFAKSFMERHRVPTAACASCETADEARRVVASGRFPFPLVVKADGLAAGKGVVIAGDQATALAAIEAMMVGRQFGAAGARVLIEEHLQGPEVSVFVIADGTRTVGFGTAQDHKRARDRDEGPNTGGMGAFSPSPLVDAALADRITREIIEPTIVGLRGEGREFRGFLYAGLMLTSDGPKVLEFNARLGDPEAQVVLPRLDEDLFPLLRDAAAGALRQDTCRFTSDVTVGVVLASGGYPDRYETGKPIAGLDSASAVPSRSARTLVFHAGTALGDGAVVTSGGRVLAVVGQAEEFAEAMAAAYRGIGHIRFDGMQYRTDIGMKAIEGRTPNTVDRIP